MRVVVVLLSIVAGVVVWRALRVASNRGPLRVESASTMPESKAAAVAAIQSSSIADSGSVVTADVTDHQVLTERDPRGSASELRA